MGHIENLHTGYVETIKYKDAQYVALAEACREEHRHLTQLIIGHLGNGEEK